MCNVCMRWEKHMIFPCECLGTAMRSSYYAVARDNDRISFTLGGSEGFQLCSSHLNCSKITSYSFNPGSCKIVRVQEKLYVEARARKPEWGGYPDTSGARWRKLVGTLRRRHLSQYLFNKINHSCIKWSQRNFPGIKHIIVKFLRLFNLSYHVVSMCEIKLQSIKIIFEGGLSSCDLDWSRRSLEKR